MHAKRQLLGALAETVPASALNDLARLDRHIQGHPSVRAEFFNLIVLTPDRQLVYSTRNSGGVVVVKSPAIRAALDDTVRGGVSVISAPFRSAMSGKPVVLITQPIFDEQGKVAMVLGGSLDLAEASFFSQLAEQKPGKTGFMYIMSGNGVLLHHPDKTRLLEHINQRPGLNTATEKALAGFQGWTEANNKEGIPGIYAYKHMKATDWIIGARYPTAEAFSPMSAMRHKAQLAAAVWAVAAGALGWLAIATLLRPLAGLRRDIAAIRSGLNDISVLARHSGGDEIGELGVAFHELMAQREAAEQRTQANARLISNILEHAPDAFVATDQAGLITEWNAQAETTFGWRRDEAVGRAVVALIVPPSLRGPLEGGLDDLAALCADSISGRMRLPALHRDGHEIPIEMSLGNLQHGDQHYTIAFLHDVTERADYERQIAASDRRARIIADSIPVLIAYVDKDRRYRFSNEHFRQMMQIAPPGHARPHRGRDLRRGILPGAKGKNRCRPERRTGALRALDGTQRPHPAADGRHDSRHQQRR